MRRVLLKNAKLLDAQYNYHPADVLIRDNRIAEVGTSVDSADTDEVVDLQGYTLMPGFFNSHLHLIMDEFIASDEVFSRMVRHGVTAVRDLSALNDMGIDEVMELRDSWSTPLHPYVFTSCKTIATAGGYGDCTPDGTHIGINAATTQEAVCLVDRLMAAGADGIKIGIEAKSEDDPGIMPSEMVRAITRRAAELNTWVAAHVMRAGFLARLVDDGISEAAHVPYDHVPGQVLEKMVRNGVILTPTVSAYIFLSRFFGPQSIEIAVDNVARFYRAGGIITVGTDCMMRPETEHEFDMPMSELRFLRQAGMTPRDIVIAATKNSALACGAEDIVGTIAPGKLANLIAVEGSLDDDLEKMSSVRFVMNKGVLITRP